jgi:hypothetical protein
VTDVFQHIEVADGRVWLLPSGVDTFAGDLPEEEKQVVWAAATAPAADLFNQKVEGVAWRSKPSAYVVAKNDRTVQPDLQRFVAKRMGSHHVRGREQPRPNAFEPQPRGRRDPHRRERP